MALIKCSECGADVSEKASVCPKCGCPIEISIEKEKDNKKANLKKGMIVGIVIILLAIIGFGIYKFCNRPDTSGYYNGFKWGMSYEDVKKQLGEDIIANDEKKSVTTSIKDYEGKTGINALVRYDCTDDSLQEIYVLISNTTDSSYTDDMLVEEYTSQFDKVYGQHTGEFTNTWNTEKSKIELIYLMEGTVTLSYEDITKIDEE